MSEPEQRAIVFEEGWVGHGFTMIPNIVLLDPELSQGAKVLYATFAFFARQSNECWPGQDRLARFTGISVRTVRTYIRELESKDLVVTERRGLRMTNVYVIKRISDFYVEGVERKLVAGLGGSDRQSLAALTGEQLPTLTGNQLPTKKTQKEEETEEERTTPSGDESPYLPGMSPPAPPKSKKEQEFEAREPLVEALWEFHVSVFGPGRVGLTEPRRKTLRGGLKAVNDDLELCKQAILGLKSYRDSHPDGSKDTSVSVVFETGMNDSRNRTEKIEWWASQAGETTRVDPLAHVPPVHKSLVTEHMVKANRLLQGKPMDPDTKTDAEISIGWLYDNYSLRGTKREDGGVKWERITR